MPLNTQVKRNGKIVEYPWSKYGALDVFLAIGLAEGDPDLPAYKGDDGVTRTFGEVEPPVFVDVANTGVYYLDTKSPLWKEGKLTLSKDWHYEVGDPNNNGPFGGFVVDLRAGDVLSMWRD